MALQSILVVDDDVDLLRALERRLQGRIATVRLVTSAAQALVAVRDGPRPDVALVDVRLGPDSGFDLAAELRTLHPGLPVILFTSHPSSDAVVRGARVGALGVLPKPVEIDQVFELLELRLPVWSEQPDPDASLARHQWNFIQRILHRCGGNVSEAARRLGISRQALQRKLGKNPVKR